MAIAAGEKATAARINEEIGVALSDTQLTSGTTTSTAFTATLTGGTACGVAFTAPPSGKVFVMNTMQVGPSGGLALSTVRVRTGSSIGSGTDVVAASDDNTVLCGSDMRGTSTTLVTGLTAGSSYNVQQLFRVTAGTGTFQRKTLVVKPTE